MKLYVACHEYEGGHAAFSTLEKAVEMMGGYCDYIEEWVVDEHHFTVNRPVVWSRDRSVER